jgi:hypothetical protein
VCPTIAPFPAPVPAPKTGLHLPARHAPSAAVPWRPRAGSAFRTCWRGTPASVRSSIRRPIGPISRLRKHRRISRRPRATQPRNQRRRGRLPGRPQGLRHPRPPMRPPVDRRSHRVRSPRADMTFPRLLRPTRDRRDRANLDRSPPSPRIRTPRPVAARPPKLASGRLARGSHRATRAVPANPNRLRAKRRPANQNRFRRVRRSIR